MHFVAMHYLKHDANAEKCLMFDLLDCVQGVDRAKWTASAYTALTRPLSAWKEQPICNLLSQRNRIQANRSVWTFLPRHRRRLHRVHTTLFACASFLHPQTNAVAVLGMRHTQTSQYGTAD
jgi:hypothetical protein